MSEPGAVHVVVGAGGASGHLVVRDLAAVGVHDTQPIAIWHVPHPAPTTGRELVGIASGLAGRRSRLATHGARQLKVLGTMVPLAREGAELVYQFEQPFVVDGSRAARAFGLTPTPYEEGGCRTLAAVRAAPRGSAPVVGRL